MAFGYLADLPRATNNDGTPISGATWTFYTTGTSTLRAVYSNSTLATSLGSTVTADSAGKFGPIYLNTAFQYRAILKDAGGSTIKDIDPVNNLDPMALLAASSGATLVSTTYGNSVQANLDGYATRAAIKALTTHTGARAYLYEKGREGWFTWDGAVLIATHQNDPGEGVYLAPNAAVNGAWVRKEALKGEVWAEWFGLDPALSDCSSVFQAINTYVGATARVSAGTYGSNIRAPNVKVLIGAGDFIVKSPKAFVDCDTWLFQQAVTYEGLGPATTSLIYSPETSGPMIQNTKGLDLGFKGMSFSGALSVTGSARCDWMWSYRGPTFSTQGVRLHEVHFKGVWRYGVHLTGENNNSEHRYTDVKWYFCDLLAWQYSPAPPTGSDQFVNYIYDRCQYVGCNGPWIDMASGGHVTIRDCDASAWGSFSGGFGARTYLFRLRGTARAFGVAQFTIDGLRVEQTHTNASIIDCEWGTGTVSVRRLDCSSQAWDNAISATAEHFRFAMSGFFGMVVRFELCQLMGKARYIYSADISGMDYRISYEGCTFLNVVRHADYFALTIPVSGGAVPLPSICPAITGRNCRAADAQRSVAPGQEQIGDFTVNLQAHNHASERRVMTFRTPEGSMPFQAYNGSGEVQLPVGARLRRFNIFAPAGHTAEAAIRSFDLKNQAGTTLATLSTVGLSSAGFDQAAALAVDITASTDILRVETTQTQVSNGGRIELEFDL